MRPPVSKQRLVPELNRVYVSTPHGIFNSLSTRSMDGYSYMENGIMKNTGLTALYRYAKNFVINKRQYVLIVMSLDSNEDKVEKFLDKTAAKLDKEKVRYDAKWADPIKVDYWYGK